MRFSIWEQIVPLSLNKTGVTFHNGVTIICLHVTFTNPSLKPIADYIVAYQKEGKRHIDTK